MRDSCWRGRLVCLVSALAWLSLAIATGCTPAPRPPRLVVLYAPCTVNKDYLAPYAEQVTYTPHLARFARDSAVFTRHYTEAGQSGIAYASIFSGGQADHHKAFRHPVHLPDELNLAAEIFADAGYETFFWNGHRMASHELGYGQGVDRSNAFRRMENAPQQAQRRGALLGADPRFEKILRKLAGDPDYKAFVMTNFTVSHGPYPIIHLDSFRSDYADEVGDLTPAEIEHFNKRYRRNALGLSWNFGPTAERMKLDAGGRAKLLEVLELLYKSNISYLDEIFGGVVDAIGERELQSESLIVFTADHGEVLFRDTTPFQWSHGMQLAPEVLNVPLLVYGPGTGVVPGVHDSITRSIDVLPTLAGLAQLPAEAAAGMPGRDLSPGLRDPKALPRDLEAYSHTTVLIRSVYESMQKPEQAPDWGQAKLFFPTEDPNLMWVSLVEGQHIYKWRNLDGTRWGMEVFDLARDRGETRNLHDPEDPHHQRVLGRLLDYKRSLVESYLAYQGEEATRVLPGEEEEKALRALGYIR